MKKQGGIFLKVIFGVLGVFVALYLLLRLLAPKSGSSLTTETAVAYEVGDGITTTGFVVRSEQVVVSGDSLLVYQRSEGEWVGAGQSIATSCRDSDAQARQAQITELEDQLAQLQYAYDHTTAENDTAALDRSIESQIIQTAADTAQRNLTAASASAGKLKTYMLRRCTGEDDSSALWTRISDLRTQLTALQAQSAADSTALTAPAAGYFSAAVDGYETVLTPDSVAEMRVADFEKLASLSPAIPNGARCRLITSNTWYYVTEAETSQLEGCETGDTVSVRFAYDFYDEMQMTIARIGDDENGKCLLVLSAEKYVSQATLMRSQAADIVFRTYSGLRVSKQALYCNSDGETGVYILQGASAKWKAVTILHDNGDSYIVTLDKSKTSNLWPGDEILITTEELYDGKVVAP